MGDIGSAAFGSAAGVLRPELAGAAALGSTVFPAARGTRPADMRRAAWTEADVVGTAATPGATCATDDAAGAGEDGVAAAGGIAAAVAAMTGDAAAAAGAGALPPRPRKRPRTTAAAATDTTIAATMPVENERGRAFAPFGSDVESPHVTSVDTSGGTEPCGPRREPPEPGDAFVDPASARARRSSSDGSASSSSGGNV